VDSRLGRGADGDRVHCEQNCSVSLTLTAARDETDVLGTAKLAAFAGSDGTISIPLSALSKSKLGKLTAAFAAALRASVVLAVGGRRATTSALSIEPSGSPVSFQTATSESTTLIRPSGLPITATCMTRCTVDALLASGIRVIGRRHFSVTHGSTPTFIHVDRTMLRLVTPGESLTRLIKITTAQEKQRVSTSEIRLGT
jgi:hypothetical protein